MDGVTTGAQNSSRLAAAGAAAGQRPKLSLSAALQVRGRAFCAARRVVVPGSRRQAPTKDFGQCLRGGES